MQHYHTGLLPQVKCKNFTVSRTLFNSLYNVSSRCVLVTVIYPCSAGGGAMTLLSTFSTALIIILAAAPGT
ncbi:MAG: hypothetical protein L3J57_08230 [Desulfuromusa sp.]|nr:hypothetical protein [Desulfuromusa sp.]